jgi:hypothetical protein
MNEVFAKAVDLIEAHGWTQGKSEDDMGRICAGQAISLAAQYSHEDVFKSIERFKVLTGIMDIPNWNDHQCVTRDDVLRKLRAAAVVESGDSHVRELVA